jgi:hypothetical protein
MSSGTIRKFMDLLNAASKPTLLNENEVVTEAPKESWVGRRTADYFAVDLHDDGSTSTPYWWLATIVDDDGVRVTIKYDNDELNDPDVFALTSAKARYSGDRPIKRGQVLLTGDVPFNPEGQDISYIEPLIDKVAYMRPSHASKLKQPAATVQKKVAAPAPSTAEKAPGTAPGTFTVSSKDLADLEDFAREGDRIMADGKAIYAGFGNRSGLHSYLSTVLADTFKKWPRAKAKLEAGAFNSLEVLTFKNVNRDRGNWIRIRSIKNANVGESIVSERTSQEQAAETAAYQKEREIQSIVYDKSGKSHGGGYHDSSAMMRDFKVRHPDGYVQANSSIMGSDGATTLWDREGSGAQVVGIWLPSAKYGFMV